MALHHRVGTVLLTILLVLQPLASVRARELQPGKEIIGDWRFTSLLDSVDITALDDKEAQKLVGKVMRIREDAARFNGYTCHAPDFEATRVEPDLYLAKEEGIDNSKLRLPKPVTVIDISCATVFVRSRDHAVISWDGFFFEARRAHANRSTHTGLATISQKIATKAKKAGTPSSTQARK